MPSIIRFIATSLIILVAGCSGEQVRQGLYHGLYEGNRMQERREMSPSERLSRPDMDYSQYSNELRQRKDSLEKPLAAGTGASETSK